MSETINENIGSSVVETTQEIAQSIPTEEKVLITESVGNINEKCEVERPLVTENEEKSICVESVEKGANANDEKTAQSEVVEVKKIVVENTPEHQNQVIDLTKTALEEKIKVLEGKVYSNDFLFDIKQGIFDNLNESNLILNLVEFIRNEWNSLNAKPKEDKKPLGRKYQTNNTSANCNDVCLFSLPPSRR